VLACACVKKAAVERWLVRVIARSASSEDGDLAAAPARDARDLQTDEAGADDHDRLRLLEAGAARASRRASAGKHAVELEALEFEVRLRAPVARTRCS